MRSVDDQLRTILGSVGPLPELEMRLLDAHGCVLSEDVVAESAVPAYDTSLVAGYAVRSADVPGTLHVTGDASSGAGLPDLVVQPNVAVRVSPGAVLPRGADAVVPAEWTDGGLAQVAVRRAVVPGEHVSRAGSDIAVGTRVLAKESIVGAAQVGVLAAIGRRMVRVRPRPRVVVVSSGVTEEDASGNALCAAVREAGAIAFHAGAVYDDAGQLTSVVEDHLIQADLLLVCGSGEIVSDVLPRLGRVSFADLAMDPGGTFAWGTVGPDEVPACALPGDTAAVLVAFEVLVRPALRRMLGASSVGRPHVSGVTTSAFATAPGRRAFVPVRVERSADRWVVTPTGGHTLSALVAANGLAVVPEGTTEVAAGTPLLTWLLERRGI